MAARRRCRERLAGAGARMFDDRSAPSTRPSRAMALWRTVYFAAVRRWWILVVIGISFGIGRLLGDAPDWVAVLGAFMATVSVLVSIYDKRRRRASERRL